MTPARWADVDRLLDEAMVRPPQERAAFLDSACSGDDELRHEVESLLAAHQKAEEKFLKQPAIEVAARQISFGKNNSLVGHLLGHYSVISVLGVGGMGEVYLARDTKLDRHVALKLLPEHYTQDAFRIKRFEREARAVSALNHPNILTIYEIGEIAGKHFLAAEYIEGQTLRELLAKGPVPVADAIEIALQIAGALAAAHEAGVIHRDIKPENVMLRRDDYVKVLDFGLAKLTERRKSLGLTNASDDDFGKTNPGAILGTIRYMSPEQAMGQEVDHRSDIFSCGVLLYELVTGMQPFKGNNNAVVLDAIVHHKEMPVLQIRPDAHPELARILGRMLEKDRSMRYQTAGDLRAVLKRLRREIDSSAMHTLISDSHSGQTQLPVRPVKARPIVLAGVACAVLIALALTTWLLIWRFGNRGGPSPWLNAYSSPVTDFPREERNPSLSPDGKLVYYARAVEGQWDIFWQRIGGTNATNLTLDSDADDTQPACSPDGASIVFRSERKGGGLFMMGATGENVRQIASFGQNPSWSPDGKQVVCGTDYILDPKRRVAKSKVLIIEVATGKERLLVGDGDAAQPRWSPGGQRVAYYFRSANNRRDIWTIPAAGGEPRPVTNDDAVDWNPVWSSDGQYLYFASDRKGVASLWRVRIDETSGQVLGPAEAVTSPTGEILQMDLSHDGRRIVYTIRFQDANLRSVNFDPAKKITTGESVPITQGSRPSGSPNVSPNGQWVAFHSLGAAQEDIWVVNSDDRKQSNLTNDDILDRSPRWSPDGNRIAFFSTRTNVAQIWLINPDGSGKRQLTFSQYGNSFPFWSPDGRRLGFQSSNNSRGTQIIEVDKPWDQQTPVELPPIPSSGDSLGGWFNGYSWSPDGKLIAGTAAELRDNEVHPKSGIYIYSLETQRYEKITDIGSRPEWLNDSRHLIFPYQAKGKLAEHQIWLVDIQTKTPKPIYSHPTYIVSTLGISADNRRIFFTATNHQADIYLLSLDK